MWRRLTDTAGRCESVCAVSARSVSWLARSLYPSLSHTLSSLCLYWSSLSHSFFFPLLSLTPWSLAASLSLPCHSPRRLTARNSDSERIANHDEGLSLVHHDMSRLEADYALKVRNSSARTRSCCLTDERDRQMGKEMNGKERVREIFTHAHVKSWTCFFLPPQVARFKCLSSTLES